MVMEASPSPQSVGREFVRQYYTLLNKAPAHLHRFYNNFSSFVHGGLDAPQRETPPVVGQKQIHNRIQQLNFRDCHAKISQVDSQATLGNGVVVQVSGELSNGGAPMRRFTQTFVLAAQSPKKYYVHNDIFRYQDIVFSDEEGSGSGRSEGEEEDAAAGAGGGYFPPPPAAFPGGFPAPPAPPHAPLVSPPPAAPAPAAAAPASAAAPAPAASAAALAPHLNGHQQQHEDSARHIAAAMHAASGLSHGAVSVELEPEGAAGAAALGAGALGAGALGAGALGAGALGAEQAYGGGLQPQLSAERDEYEQEREISPPPQPAVLSAASASAAPEPKTYANLLKSGSALGGAHHVAAHAVPAYLAAYSHPAAPAHAHAAPHAHAHESRARPTRTMRDTQQPQGDGPLGMLGGGAMGGGGALGGGGGGGGGGASRRYSDLQQLFLGNLPHSATEDELRALFARFGPVAELRVHSKPAAPGQPRHPNYGFITYENAQAAADCLSAAPLYFPCDGADVKLNVEEKKTRTREAPRRRPLSSHRAPFRQPYRR